jgi:hypothetical protein
VIATILASYVLLVANIIIYYAGISGAETGTEVRSNVIAWYMAINSAFGVCEGGFVYLILHLAVRAL